MPSPQFILMAGPNGAGKTSTARHLFPDLFASDLYVDPDRIQRGNDLSTIAAGRLAIEQCKAQLSKAQTFARETTLSGHEPLHLLEQAISAGLKTTLIYMCADNRDVLKARVAARVAMGGHDIPANAQDRRYDRSLSNVATILDKVNRFVLIDNSGRYRRIIWDSALKHQPAEAVPRPDWIKRLAICKVTRLQTRPQFVFVRGGKSERRKSLVVQARANRHRGAAIGEGFTATKKVGNAVVRNRAKRRLRAAAQQLLPTCGQPGFDYVFIARSDTATIGWARLLDDMESALISLANQFSAGAGSA